MLNVLQTQLYRLKQSKLFWALFIVVAVLPIVGMLITLLILFGLASAEGGVSTITEMLKLEGGNYTVYTIGEMANINSDAVLFSIICSSIFLSGEFSGGSIRNMVLANKSRTQIFLSFLSVSLIIGFAYFGVEYLTTLASYGIVMGFGGVSVSKSLSICFASLFLGLIGIALAQSCVCMFLFTTRKTGPTVAFPILLIIFAPSVVATFVNIVAAVTSSLGQGVSEIVQSWIPLYNMVLYDNKLSDTLSFDGALVGKIALYNIPLAAILATFSWLAISKADLK